MWTALFLLFAGYPPGDTDAAKLFRQTEQKLSKAKTLQCTFEIKGKEGKKMLIWRGSLLIAQGNKSRFELNDRASGKPSKRAVFVSDGVRIADLADKTYKPTTVPKWYSERILESICRTGVFGLYLSVGFLDFGPEKFEREKELRVSGFRLGKKETLGTKEAQIIEFTLDPKGTNESNKVTLWLDAKTNLPLKRVLSEAKGASKITLTETYAEFKLDEEIEPKNFQLPK